MDVTVRATSTEHVITPEQVRQNKRIMNSLEDDLIAGWIEAAEDYVERTTNRALMTQELTLSIPMILKTVSLPRPPFESIQEIRLTPDEGAASTIPGTGSGIMARVRRMVTEFDVPDVTFSKPGYMEIDYTAGASIASAVPAALKQAVLLLASHYLTSREAAYMDPRLMMVQKKIPYGVDELCARYRVPNVTADYD